MSSTRREFLSAALGSTAVVSLSGAAPSFLLRAAASEPTSKQETVLVVVQLSGGNDGLNTIVPYADDAYHKARPELKIAESDVLKIDDYAGFHPAMKPLAGLLEAGKLGVVQGIGYPGPNRSHFESMDIWHTCRRKNEPRSDGWLGRYLDQTVKDDGGDVAALHLGAEKQPLALAAQRVRALSVASLDRFRLQTGGNDDVKRAIDELAAMSRPGGDLLSFVQTSSAAALSASKRVEQAAKAYKTEVEYPKTGLAGKLRTAAQLIDAGLDTRIYYVTLDGFDTHSQQPDAHAALLTEFSGAVDAFIRDVALHGHGQRVVLTAFSEFGRRVAENASRGTDHGAAAPMFLAGERIKPGLIGAHPSLTDLVDGDLKHHTDFRQVYAALLDNWLGFNSESVIGGKFQPVVCLAKV